MDTAAADRIGQQLRSVFPDGAITRVRVLHYGDDPEVEPGQAAIRVFFDWPGRSEGGQANPKTLHAFLTGNAAALDVLRHELPTVIGWVEFRPDSADGKGRDDGVSYRFTDRGRRAAGDDGPEDFTPVMTRLGPADLATIDSLIAAGTVKTRAEALRWAVGRLREHRA